MAKRIKPSGSATNCIWAFFFGVVLVCLLFFSSQTQADVGDWEQLGPWGGDRFRIYVAPEDNQKLYVVGNSIHRSLDGGETWTNLENPSSSVSAMLVYSLAMDPTDTQTLYVGTLLNGLWKTTSGGDTWNQINNGILNDDQIIRSVLVDASKPNTVYASTSKYSAYSDTRGVPDKNVIRAVYRSIDAGETWEPFDTGIPGPPAITALFQDPFTLDIFAATYEYGIYKYDSILNIWTAKNTGLSAPEGFFVTHLAFDPNIQDTILATTKKDWVYKSEDGGGTWRRLDFTEPLDQPYPPMAYHAAIDPNNSNVIWLSAFPGGNNQDESPFYHADADQDKGGLFLSLDGGESWSRQPWPDAFPNAGPFGITLDPTETITRDDLGVTLSSTFYATGGGVFSIMKSVDGGQNFEKKNDGVIGYTIDSFCQNPADNSSVYATSEGALHISFDSARSWSALLPTAQEGIQEIWDVNVDLDNPNILYYAIGEPAWDHPEHKGLYRVDLFELNPEDSFHDGPGYQIPSTAGIGIWKIYTRPNSTIYLATQTNGVLKSIDAGANWQDMNAGLENASVTCLAFDSMLEPLFAGVRQNDGTKYPPWWEFDEPGGVYKWNDLSQSWTRIGEDLIQCAVFSVKISPDNPNKVFVAGIDGVFVSEDGGATWEKKDRGLPYHDETFGASDIVIDPNHPNRIVVSSFYLGIWASTDGGDHWFNFSNNLNRLCIQNLIFDSGPDLYLYATTQGTSISRCRMQLGEAPVLDSLTVNGEPYSEPYQISMKELETVEIHVEAHDPDGKDLTYQAMFDLAPVPAPGEDPESAFTFDPGTHIFRFTSPLTSARPGQPYKLEFLITNGVLGTWVTVEITVLPLSPPKIDSVTANGVDLTEPYHVSLKELETVEIQIKASDDDGDVLIYQAWLYGMPAPAPGEDPDSAFTFDPATQIFKWIPPVTSARPEAYTLSITVEDGVFVTLAEVEITVLPLSPPKIDSVTANGVDLTEPYHVSLKELETVEIQIKAGDDDGDVLIYQAWLYGMPAPAPGEDPDSAFTFDPATQIFKWIPPVTSARPEAYTLSITVEDGVFVTLAEVEITVLPLSPPKIDSVTANGVDLTEPYHVSLKELETVEIQIKAGDDDGDVLIYQAWLYGMPAPAPGEDPDSAFTFDPATQIFKWIPPVTSARPEAYTLSITVEDGVFVTLAEVEITVLPLSPPKIDSVTANGVDLTEPYHVSLKELETVEIQIKASDDDGDVLIYQAWLYGMPAPAPGEDPDSAFTFDPATQIFKWIPPVTSARPDQPYQLYLLVSDGVFPPLWVIVEIQVNPVISPEISLAINQELFHPGDELRIDMTLRNEFSQAFVDLYLAFGTPDCPLTTFIPSDRQLASGVYLLHGLLLEDIPIIRYTFPSMLTKSASLNFSDFKGLPGATRDLAGSFSLSLTYTMILVPAGEDVMDPEKRLSSDTVQFYYEIP